MTVNFVSTAAINQRTERNINDVLTQRNEAGRQIQTEKKFENIYDASASEANDMVNIQESIDVQKKEVEILQKGFRRANEMSDSLADMEKYLKSELANWQKSASGAMSDDFTQEKQVDFAERLLKGMEGFLNKKSIYDGTYLFSGENMDTKPVSLSGNVDADKYYLGSKYDMSFTYGVYIYIYIYIYCLLYCILYCLLTCLLNCLLYCLLHCLLVRAIPCYST